MCTDRSYSRAVKVLSLYDCHFLTCWYRVDHVPWLGWTSFPFCLCSASLFTPEGVMMDELMIAASGVQQP